MEDNLGALAQNVRRLRASKGISQEALAKLAGCTSVAMIEAGRITSPRMDTLEGLASALGVTVAELFSEPKQSRRKKSE